MTRRAAAELAATVAAALVLDAPPARAGPGHHPDGRGRLARGLARRPRDRPDRRPRRRLPRPARRAARRRRCRARGLLGHRRRDRAGDAARPGGRRPRTGRGRLRVRWGALPRIAAITAWRLGCPALSRTDLFVHEAQYGLRGQELAFGYFSKPPLLAWVIRATAVIGGDVTFRVRAPGPVLFAAASVAVLRAARRVWPAAAADRAGVAFATLPGVSVPAPFISTDAVLPPCFALAILAALAVAGVGAGGRRQLGLARLRRRRDPRRPAAPAARPRLVPRRARVHRGPCCLHVFADGDARPDLARRACAARQGAGRRAWRR